NQELISKLPMRLLGIPNQGALAFIGHVDRAWQFSITATDARQMATPGLFSEILRQLMNGYTVGFAMDGMPRRFARDATLVISGLLARPSMNERELTIRRLAATDIRNYVIIGDPAVSSPARGGELR